MIYSFFFIILSAFLLFTGCSDTDLDPGIVAKVNGEAITLHSIQTLIDCRSASMGIPPRPLLDEMKKNYVNALKILIIHKLVRQEMKERRLIVDDRTFNQYIRSIIDDYGEDDFKKFFQDSYIREDDWLQLMYDFLALETFKSHLLLPTIKISKEEIKAYYNANESRFKIPDTINLCFLSATSEKLINDWCVDLKKELLTHTEYVQCGDLSLKDIPEPWQQEVGRLAPNSCAKIVYDNGMWKTVAVLDKPGKKTLDIINVYALIENILLQQKQQGAFDKWLNQKIKKSRILVTPEYNKCISESVQENSAKAN